LVAIQKGDEDKVLELVKTVESMRALGKSQYEGIGPYWKKFSLFFQGIGVTKIERFLEKQIKLSGKNSLERLKMLPMN
jgi:hypothetical protein